MAKEAIDHKKEDSQESPIPPELTEVLDAVPNEEQRKMLKVMVSSQFSMMGRISPEFEISKKVTSDHITAMLQTNHEAMTNSFKENGRKSWMRLAYAVIGCTFVIVVIVLLKDNPEVMKEVLKIGMTAIVSLAGGFGIGYYQRGKDD